MIYYDDVVLADAPLAYWLLDEVSAPYSDMTGNYDIASWSGSQTTGPNGWGALSTSSSVTTALKFSAVSGVTVECWLKTTTSRVTFSARSGPTPGVALFLDAPVGGSSGRIASGWDADNTWIGRSDTSGPSSCNDGEWHHLVATWQQFTTSVFSDQFAAYVDGVRVDDSSQTIGGGTAPLSSSWLLLNSSSAPINLARFAVYDTCLGPRQIALHYSTALSGPTGIWSIV